MSTRQKVSFIAMLPVLVTILIYLFTRVQTASADYNEHKVANAAAFAKLETSQKATAEWLERVEGKLDKALARCSEKERP